MSSCTSWLPPAPPAAAAAAASPCSAPGSGPGGGVVPAGCCGALSGGWLLLGAGAGAASEPGGGGTLPGAGGAEADDVPGSALASPTMVASCTVGELEMSAGVLPGLAARMSCTLRTTSRISGSAAYLDAHDGSDAISMNACMTRGSCRRLSRPGYAMSFWNSCPGCSPSLDARASVSSMCADVMRSSTCEGILNPCLAIICAICVRVAGLSSIWRMTSGLRAPGGSVAIIICCMAGDSRMRSSSLLADLSASASASEL
mmetsp:Transcript_27469/g.69856  ORF Transcript_27469/g.69856 Transcript_27469/m.69856 type:complete len:259 (-) Transcript_27469:111-887(-)